MHLKKCNLECQATAYDWSEWYLDCTNTPTKFFVKAGMKSVWSGINSVVLLVTALIGGHLNKVTLAE